MKNIIYIIFGIFLLTTSCVKEPMTQLATEGKPITLYITVSEREEEIMYNTKASSEVFIEGNSVYFIVMSGKEPSSVVLDYGVATEISVAGGRAYTVDIPERTDACHGLIIVNAKAILDTHSATWTKGTTTLAEISAAMQTEELPADASGIITAMPSSHPMTGFHYLPKGITKNMSIGDSTSPVILLPSTVKVTVENRVLDGNGYKFSLIGANLGNTPRKSFIMPNQTGEIATGTYGKNGDVSQMFTGVTTIEAIETTEPLYGYEVGADKETFIILKANYNGVDGYYKLAFYVDKNTFTNRPLLRGYHYKMAIRKVLTAGYQSIVDALAGAPSNDDIIYDINVDDRDSYDIVTNGAQYLGVSNSAYIAYHTNFHNQFDKTYTDGVNNTSTKYALTPFKATVLTYTADPTWQPGTITATEGIILLDETLNKVTSIPLEIPAVEGQTVRKELNIFMTNEFRKGYIHIHVGNLHKAILVERNLSFSIMGDSVSFGRDIKYVKTRTLPNPMAVEDFSPPFSDPTGYSLAYGKNGAPILTGDGRLSIDPAQELFLQIKRCYNKPNQLHSYGEIYLHHNNYKGRHKVEFATDVQGLETQADVTFAPYFPVSQAFWRNDQKGERLIQMSQSIYTYDSMHSNLVGRWQARVLVGADFINIDEWDPNITVTNNRFDGDAEDRPVLEGKDLIGGNQNIVRFRIGLKSTNEGKPNRYGLIHVRYIDHSHNGGVSYGSQIKNSCIIMVRQGESPDHLLTPGKTYTNHVTWETFVAPDVEFAYADLIDPTNGTGGPNVSDHTLITDNVRPTFPAYPSYAVSSFQWGGDRMYNPLNSSEILFPMTGWQFWNETTKEGYATRVFKEHCPAGYITPPAKINGIDVTLGLRCGIYTDKSQSDYPYHFYQGNIYRGYCVDGYFDRYIMLKDPNDPNNGEFECHAPHAPLSEKDFFKDGSCTVFNPDTFANIYFQEVKRVRDGSYYEYDEQVSGGGGISPGGGWGEAAVRWTSDEISSGFYNLASSFSFGWRNFSLQLSNIDCLKASGLPIRCIKDPATRKK